MDRRVIAVGLVLVLFGLFFFGLGMSGTPLVMAVDSATSNLSHVLRGRLDVTVIIISVAWTLDLVNTNTGQSIANQDVPAGSQISFAGKMLDTNGQPISDYWVSLNLIPEGKTVESGDQCWIGSAKTNSQGVFGSSNYVEIKADGWWSNYPGVDGAYIQTKNGADNLGCQAWATETPVGKSVLGYAAISKTIYSSSVGFKVTAGAIGCDITGSVYVNDVKACSGDIRMPPTTTWAFATGLTAAGITKVTVSWTGSASGSKELVSVSAPAGGMRWEGTTTLIQGSYTIKVTCACAGGTSKTILTANAMVREGPVEVTCNLIQQLRDNLFWISVPFFAIGIVAVGYGVRKETGAQ